MSLNCKPKCKPGKLECELQQLETFQSTPGLAKSHLEQYDTPPHIAAHLLYGIQSEFGDIEGKNIIDLGCGCGVLSIGCVQLGASSVLAVDIDKQALDVARDNADSLDSITFLECDIHNLCVGDIPHSVDTVIMNPPFGTQATSNGIDRVFIEKALQLSDIVYSMHKTSTSKYLSRIVAKEMGVVVKPVITVSYNIERLFKHHKKASCNINVDLIRITRQ